MMNKFPLIPPEVVEALEKQFPQRSPVHNESHDDLMWRGGQCSVVELLKSKLKEQQSKV